MKSIKILTPAIVFLLVLSIVIPVAAANGILNPGIETGTGTNADDWTEGTDHARSSDRAHAGTYSLKSSNTGSAQAITSQTMYFSTGTWYVSYWAYRENGTGTAWMEAGNIYKLCQFYTDTGLVDQWQFVSGTCNVTGNYSGHVYLVTDDLTDAVYFDDLCASKTSEDCPGAEAPTPTPTSTFTPTITFTPTSTFTPTETPTPTNTPTITDTPLSSPTITDTPVPGTVIWADGPVTLSEALLEAIADLLEGDPPDEADGWIYATTNVSGVDTSWNVSLVNLVDVDPPYEEWSLEENGAWSWFVQCTGSEPTWTCDYYELPAMGGEEGLRLPWRTGYQSKYGILGVHEGAQMVPGSVAVDFVSGDSAGPSAAPDTVIAAASGVITSVCSDGRSMAIRVDGGPVPLAYFHFQTGQTFSEGQIVTQGQVLGVLKHGSFLYSPLYQCGWGDQMPDTYHLHFVFLPTSPGYLEIGGCVLNLSTENFVCDGVTYPINSWLPNGGSSGTPDEGGTSGDTIEAGGGAHIWDGIVDMIVRLNSDVSGEVLPEQDPFVGYMLEKADLIIQALLSIFAAFYVIGISGNFLFIAISAVISAELILLLNKVVFWFGRLIIPFI